MLEMDVKAPNLKFCLLVIAWKKATCTFFYISPHFPQMKEHYTGLLGPNKLTLE